MKNDFPRLVEQLFGRLLPGAATPAGYAALIDRFSLPVPIPRRLTIVAPNRRNLHADEEEWRVLPPSYLPESSLIGHLTFALKHEGVDLALLKRLFQTIGGEPVVALVQGQPTGSYARRIWFLYEWLLDKELDLPAAEGGRYTSVIDPEMQYGGKARSVRRQRVYNNIPGTREFAPLVFRTRKIEEVLALNLAGRAASVLSTISSDHLSRAAAFLLLKDSRASFTIEGERPQEERIKRWGQAIAEAGVRPLDQEELLRLQRVVLGEKSFVELGFRTDGGFVGAHERQSRRPIPEHISARAEDLPSLINGMLAFNAGRSKELDPVIATAILTFGFIYVHPFVDGNGRIHRYLMHHHLAERRFTPPGIIFPLSAAILQEIGLYREVLESYSQRLLPVIDWTTTENFNVAVTNDTADFYRYFDATPHTEFLFDRLARTIDVDLPEEAAFLKRYDRFSKGVRSFVDMPEQLTDLLFSFLTQNDGKLSKRARSRKFARLTEKEIQKIEALFADATDRS